MTCRITQEALRDYVWYARSGRVVVFDTETTGIACGDEIIQLAAAEYVGGSLARTLNLYLVPTVPIHPEAEAVHHLTMPFLVAHGVAPSAALERFFDFLGDDVLLVGHNIHFDFRMLNAECAKFGFEANPSDVLFCDTIALAKKLVPGLEHYSLAHLIATLHLEGQNSHDALDDTLACGNLFFDLIRRLPWHGEALRRRPMAPDDYVCEPVWGVAGFASVPGASVALMVGLVVLFASLWYFSRARRRAPRGEEGTLCDPRVTFSRPLA